jgi:hypothetical protein
MPLTRPTFTSVSDLQLSGMKPRHPLFTQENRGVISFARDRVEFMSDARRHDLGPFTLGRSFVADL